MKRICLITIFAFCAALARAQDTMPARLDVKVRYQALSVSQYNDFLAKSGGKEFLDNLGYRLESKGSSDSEAQLERFNRSILSKEKGIKDSLAVLEKNKEMMGDSYASKKAELERSLKTVQKHKESAPAMVEKQQYAPMVQEKKCKVSQVFKFSDNSYQIQTACVFHRPNLDGFPLDLEALDGRVLTARGAPLNRYKIQRDVFSTDKQTTFKFTQ